MFFSFVLLLEFAQIKNYKFHLFLDVFVYKTPWHGFCTSVEQTNQSLYSMNKLQSLTMWCMLACSVAAQAVCVSAQLSDVVVYRTGAELRQTAAVSLLRGDNEIRLDGLSPVAEAGSFRISLDNGVCLVSHEYGVEALPPERSTALVRSLRDSLSAAEQRCAALSDEAAALTQMLTLLSDGVGQTLSAARQPVTAAAIDKGLEFYRQRSADLCAQRAAVEREKQTWTDKAAAFKEQLEEQTARNAGKTGVLTLRLNAPQACRALIDLRYFTYAASWQPAYEASIASAQGPFVLASNALLAQTTGLDWEQVHLTLSSALPRSGLVAPEPSKWLIDYLGLKRAIHYYRANADASYEAAVEEDAAAGDAWNGREFAVETPYTVPADGKPQTVALGREILDSVTYDRYTVPQADTRVYLRAQIKGLDRSRLMPGNVAVSYDGTYYGEQYLDPSADDGETTLTLGEEAQIAVSRERVEEYTQTRHLANKTRITALYKITVRNNTSDSATVTLREAYPVSAAEGIEVELLPETTRWQHNDTDRGILTYQLVLPPAATRELLIGYTVTHPKSWRITFR